MKYKGEKITNNFYVSEIRFCCWEMANFYSGQQCYLGGDKGHGLRLVGSGYTWYNHCPFCGAKIEVADG